MINYYSITISFMGGVIIGLASWLLWISTGRIAGISGIVSGIFKNKHADKLWRIIFVIGLLLGGLMMDIDRIKNNINPINTISTVNTTYTNTNNTITTFQFNHFIFIINKPITLIIAGLLVGFGTVIGSGCTSGHGVCGLGRRSKRSLVATLTFMVAGFITTALLQFI